MPLALQLLRVSDGVWKKGGHVEHDFLLTETRVNRLFASLAVMSVEAAAITFKILKWNTIADHGKELVECRIRSGVTEQLLFGGLSKLLINYALNIYRDYLKRKKFDLLYAYQTYRYW